MHTFLKKPNKIHFLILAMLLLELTASATIHIIRVRDSSTQFVPQYEGPILLGDTIHWLPMGEPLVHHTITSTDIPPGAEPFNAPWSPPDQVFFEYVPTEVGTYNYVCLPHQSQGMIGDFVVEGPLSADYRDVNDDIRIFPNPVQDRIYFSQSGRFTQFRIYSLDGQLIQSGRQTSDHIPVDALDRGVYVIELTGERRSIQKFIKD